MKDTGQTIIDVVRDFPGSDTVDICIKVANQLHVLADHTIEVLERLIEEGKVIRRYNLMNRTQHYLSEDRMTEYTASRCGMCNAITVNKMDGLHIRENWSMTEEEHALHFPGVEVDMRTPHGCNYCHNNWGISLCACGSGEHYEECQEGFPNCGTPAQTIGEAKDRPLWVF